MLQPRAGRVGADVANSPPHTVRIPWRVFKLCNHRVPYRIFLKIYEEGRVQAPLLSVLEERTAAAGLDHGDNILDTELLLP